MLAFCGHASWRKPENPGKTTDLGRATTTLPHADTRIRSQVAAVASECVNHCAIQAPGPGLSPKATGLHLEGVGGTPWGAHWHFPLVGPRSGCERWSLGLGRDLIKIRNLALGSQVRHGFSGLKSKGNGVTPRRCWRGHPRENTGTSR